ncbi:MAG: TolC family protein [Paludibacteraceae bacterium]|nr:TolC family protein [Paludibacteraceae bacterium]
MKSVIKKGGCLLAITLMMGSSMYAQANEAPSAVLDSAHVISFTLDEAKKYALEHNRTIQNASYDVKKAEADRWKAIASMLLQVNGNVDYYNMFGYEMNMGGMKMPMPPYFDFGVKASATVSGSQIIGVKLANMARDLSQVAVAKTDQAITSNIETSYINILALETMTRLLEQGMLNLDSLYKMTLNAVRVGAAEQNAADQIAVQVAMMKSQVNSTQRTIEVMYNSIRLLTGVPADVDIVLSQKIEDVVNAASIMELMGSDLNLYNNYDYQLKSQSTELSKKQVTLSKMAYVPSLTAFYAWDKKEYPTDKSGGFNTTPPNTFGLTLNVPIWSSGSRYADVKGAKIEYAKAQNELEDTELQLRIQEKQLRYNLVSAFENYQIQNENMEVMQRVFKSNTEKFKYGTISSMDLTRSSTDLVNAQNTYVSALVDMITAHVELKKLLNK